MRLTITLSAALALGVTVFILCRYAGLKILHATVMRHIRFLSRLVQPRAGHREHHTKPVPTALAKRRRKGSRRKEADSEHKQQRVPRTRDARKGAYDRSQPKEVVPYDHHATQPAAHPPTPDRS